MTVVEGVNFDVMPGEIVGLVGESGSGKSMTARSVLRLVPKTADLRGSIRFRGRELVGLAEAQMRAIRGNDISVIFQEPMTSLNPVMRIGRQITEPLMLHQGLSKREADQRAADMLDLARMRSMIENWPSSGFERLDVNRSHHIALTRGFSVGRFLLQYDPDMKAIKD